MDRPPAMTLTDAAVARIKSLLDAADKPVIGIRVGVSVGIRVRSCSGSRVGLNLGIGLRLGLGLIPKPLRRRGRLCAPPLREVSELPLRRARGRALVRERGGAAAQSILSTE